MTEINENELAIRLRNNILGVLELWTSKNKQLEYQDNVPIANVSVELFCQWDDFYYPDSVHFKLAFDDKERESLDNFNKVLNHISDKTTENLPYISDFVKTNDWLLINQAAIDTTKKLKNSYQINQKSNAENCSANRNKS